MSAILLPSGRLRYHAYINGVYGPAVGYKLYTYEAGTTTPKDTYADADAATVLSNPIVLDANGECAPYGSGSYKLTLTDPAGATVWTQDDIVLTASVAEEEWCGTAGGTPDALTIAPTTAITSYEAGQRFSFIAAAANTGAVTVSVSGLAAKSLTWNGNTALAAGDLVMGRVYQAQYDGTRFQLSSMPYLSSSSSTSDSTKRLVTSEFLQAVLTARTASESATGLVELATAAEYNTGTDTGRVPTVKTLRDNNIVAATAQATTSGTSKDFTDIPAWVKKITVMLSGVSGSGTSSLLVQIGDAGGIENSGYLSSVTSAAGASSAAASTAGFIVSTDVLAASTYHGAVTLSKLDGNTWVAAGLVAQSGTTAVNCSAGSKTLSATLDRVRLTTVNGTDTFDAGTVNISYE